jgi:CheY-like chemotaxis protein
MIRKRPSDLPGNPVQGILADLHILVLDDDDDARFIMADTLRHFGALVSMAATPKKIFSMLSCVNAHVIVSDLAMPEKDGLAFIREVRLNGTLRDVPAIAVTAYADFFGVSRITKAGFNAVLRKPIDPPELVATVARLLRRA